LAIEFRAICLAAGMDKTFDTYNALNVRTETGLGLLFVFGVCRLAIIFAKTDAWVFPDLNHLPSTDAVNEWAPAAEAARSGAEGQMTERGPRSNTGRVHGLIAIVTFVSICASSFVFRFDEDAFDGTPWSDKSDALRGLAIAQVVTLVAMVVLRRMVGYFGLWERLFYVAFFAWLFLAGSVLIQS